MTKKRAKRLTFCSKSTVGRIYDIRIQNNTVWYTNDNGHNVPSFLSDWQVYPMMRQEHRKTLIKTFSTLLYSWGGDTPQEAIWAANELIDWINLEFGVTLSQLNLDGDMDRLEREIKAL